MSEEPELTLEEFMAMPEAPPVSAGSTDHKEASIASHLLEFAKSRGFTPFKVSEWLNQAKADNIFEAVVQNGTVGSIEKAITRYSSMDLVDNYQKTDKHGETSTKYYIKSPVITALRNITRGSEVYFQRRGETVIILPIDKLPEPKNNKAKAFKKSLERNRSFMYTTKDRAALF